MCFLPGPWPFGVLKRQRDGHELARTDIFGSASRSETVVKRAWWGGGAAQGRDRWQKVFLRAQRVYERGPAL